MNNDILSQIKIPDFSPIKVDTPIQHMWADEQFEIIKEYIERFEKNVDSEHEVGVLLTNFGQSVLMQVRNITYRNPVLLIFNGFVNGKESVVNDTIKMS